MIYLNLWHALALILMSPAYIFLLKNVKDILGKNGKELSQ